MINTFLVALVNVPSATKLSASVAWLKIQLVVTMFPPSVTSVLVNCSGLSSSHKEREACGSFLQDSVLHRREEAGAMGFIFCRISVLLKQPLAGAGSITEDST